MIDKVPAADGEFMKRNFTYISCTVLLLSFTAFAWQAPASSDSTPAAVPASTTTTSAPNFSERHPRYELQPSDSFDVVFDYTPEFNQTVMVEPDGFIHLRSIGDMNVRNLTVAQATDQITQAYSKILSKPKVSLVLKDFQKPYFIADGQVRTPGKYELRGDTTVVQALAMAGGLQSQYAKHSQVVLYRRVNDVWAEGRVIDVKKMQNSHNLTEDVLIQPGDLIFVPKNGASKVQQWLPIYSVNALGAQSHSF
jgi:polysaccharide biosynthesis/export protein